MINPKGHPRQHDDQNGGKIRLEDEVAHVPMELETERQSWILPWNIQTEPHIISLKHGCCLVNY